MLYERESETVCSYLSKKEYIDNMLDQFELTNIQHAKIGDGVTKASISGGQSKLLSIASALMKNSVPILIFDEPTSALDDGSAEKVMKVLKRYARLHKKTIILSIHQADNNFLNNYIDNIYLMSVGSCILSCSTNQLAKIPQFKNKKGDSMSKTLIRFADAHKDYKLIVKPESFNFTKHKRNFFTSSTYDAINEYSTREKEILKTRIDRNDTLKNHIINNGNNNNLRFHQETYNNDDDDDENLYYNNSNDYTSSNSYTTKITIKNQKNLVEDEARAKYFSKLKFVNERNSTRKMNVNEKMVYFYLIINNFNSMADSLMEKCNSENTRVQEMKKIIINSCYKSDNPHNNTEKTSLINNVEVNQAIQTISEYVVGGEKTLIECSNVEELVFYIDCLLMFDAVACQKIESYENFKNLLLTDALSDKRENHQTNVKYRFSEIQNMVQIHSNQTTLNIYEYNLIPMFKIKSLQYITTLTNQLKREIKGIQTISEDNGINNSHSIDMNKNNKVDKNSIEVKDMNHDNDVTNIEYNNNNNNNNLIENVNLTKMNNNETFENNDKHKKNVLSGKEKNEVLTDDMSETKTLETLSLTGSVDNYNYNSKLKKHNDLEELIVFSTDPHYQFKMDDQNKDFRNKEIDDMTPNELLNNEISVEPKQITDINGRAENQRNHVCDLMNKPSKQNLLKEIILLFKFKTFRLYTLSNILVYTLTMSLLCFTCAFLFQDLEWNVQGSQGRIGFVFSVLVTIMILNIQNMNIFYDQAYPSNVFETKRGTYTMAAWHVSNILTNILFHQIIPSLVLFLPYYIIGMKDGVEHLFVYFFGILSFFITSGLHVYIIGYISLNYAMAISIYCIYVLCSVSLSGLLLSDDNVGTGFVGLIQMHNAFRASYSPILISQFKNTSVTLNLASLPFEMDADGTFFLKELHIDPDAKIYFLLNMMGIFMLSILFLIFVNYFRNIYTKFKSITYRIMNDTFRSGRYISSIIKD
jgi:ABC-type multidrug transport system ATPase subunit